MLLQDFDVTAATVQEFFAFCERLERAKKYSTTEERKDKSPGHIEKKSHCKNHRKSLTGSLTHAASTRN